MNELKLFENYDIHALREFEKAKKEYDGFVYVVEADDVVKIGCTHRLVTRMSTLSGMLSNYADKNVGRIAVTKPHMNYRENEKKMHEMFSDCRKGGELFAIDFETAVEGLSTIYLETSEELRNKMKKRGDALFEQMKNFTLHGLPQVKEEQKLSQKKQTFIYKVSMKEVGAHDAAALLLRLMLGEFVLNDEQRDSCIDMANEIAMYKNCKINFSLQFDCDEIDDCSDLLDATDFEGTYDES